MPWATIGAFGCAARNSFHTDACLPGNSAFNTTVSGTIELLEQPADARDAPVDPVLAKCLVDEVRVAARQIRAERRPPAETGLFDEQREGDGDLSSGGPDGNRDGGARECGDPVGRVLRQGRARKLNGEQRRACAADERDEFATFHSITSSARGGATPGSPDRVPWR